MATYTSSAYNFGGSKEYRAVLVLTYDDSTKAKAVIDWTVKVQMIYGSLWGVGIKCTGAASGSATGYLKSSPGGTWTTVASKSGTLEVPRTTSEQSKKFTATAYGTTVSGYGSAGGSISVSHTVGIDPLEKYTVSYNGNGHTGGTVPGNQTKWYGKTLTLSSTKPTRSGYTFVGWGTSSSDTSANYSAGGSYTANASDTLYAIWKKTITLTYNANNGSGAPAAASATVYNSTTSHTFTISSTKPTRTGYTFLGWSKSSSATSSSYSSGGSISLSSSDTLYAVWKINTYVVLYNGNENTGGTVPGNQTKTYGQTLPLSSSVPTKTGYTFQGWGTSSTTTTVSYAPGGSYTANAAITLYAVWKINTYAISYNANGGSDAPAAQTKTYGQALTLSSVKPTRPNYDFLGWGTSSSATTVAYAAGSSYTDDAPLALYAVWKLSHKEPTITNLKAIRTDSGGNSDDEAGTYAKITFNWTIDSNGNTGGDNDTVLIQYKKTTASSWTSLPTENLSGASDSFMKNISLGTTDDSYNIKVTITDKAGLTAFNTTFVSAVFFTIDFKSGGKGIAFGAPATEEGFTCAMDTNFTGNFEINNKTIFDLIYPVGAIYLSTVNTSPATLFGGTWVQIKDTFLLAAGSSYAAGATGGAATVKLKASESGVPAHGHDFTQPSVALGSHSHTGNTNGEYFVMSESSGAYNAGFTAGASGQSRRVDAPEASSAIFHHRSTTSSENLGTKTATGGAVQNNTAADAASAHNNMPPYLAVYVWKRTA